MYKSKSKHYNNRMILNMTEVLQRREKHRGGSARMVEGRREIPKKEEKTLDEIKRVKEKSRKEVNS